MIVMVVAIAPVYEIARKNIAQFELLITNWNKLKKTTKISKGNHQVKMIMPQAVNAYSDTAEDSRNVML